MKLRGEPPFVLALDVGTSSTRALLFDAGGRREPDVSARAPHHLTTTPDGAALLDPDELYEIAAGCLKAVREAPVELVAMDSFWHSLMGVDGDGRPTTPVLTWADTRSSLAAAELRDRLDEREVHRRTGCLLRPSYWPAKLLWLSQADPAVFRRTRRWLSFAEWCQWRLTGELACSVSMASGTGLLNQRTSTWDGELLGALPVEQDQLSPLVDLDHRLRDLRLTAGGSTARLGWPSLAAVGDGASSNVGSGGASPDRLAVNVGTSSAMRALLISPAVDPPPGLWCYRLDRRRIVLGGALSEGGNLWGWLRAALRLPSVKASEAELAAMAPDAHGLTMLPFIAGERSPGWAAGARLTITNMHLATRPIDLMRAAMEAVAYRLHEVYRRLEPLTPGCEIVASGNAILSSPAWLQILADVLNRPLLALADPEATARGAALLALEALGVSPAPTFRHSRTYLPDAARHARYLEAAARQAALYQQVIG